MKKCLIIDDMHPDIVSGLKSIGFDVSYEPGFKRQDVLRHIGEYEGLVVRSKIQVDAEIVGEGKKLEFVARAGAGVDNIDKAALKSSEIALFAASEANKDAVAEQTIGMMLSMLHNVVKGDKEVRKYVWDREGNRGTELGALTVGIIGYGNIGKEVHKRLSSFGCHVLAYDKRPEKFAGTKCQPVQLKDIYEQSDIVTFHIPLDDHNYELVDRSYLEKFKKSIWLLNTSRGKVLVLKDLLQMLESGKVRGAALDVLENENISDLNDNEKEVFEALIASDRVILTPHVAGWSFESYQKISQVLVEKVKLFYNKQKGL